MYLKFCTLFSFYQFVKVVIQRLIKRHELFFMFAIQLSTKRLRLYPSSSKTQAYVERFNWILEDESINYEINTIY
jgi:hypothetical protein